MHGTTQKLKIAALKRHSVRQRKRSDAELIALAESWLAMPIHPIVVRPDLTVADGHGRLDGLELLGKTEAEVFVTGENLSDEQLDEIGFITAYHRQGLNPYEQAQIYIRKRKAGATNQDTAKSFNIDPGYGSKLYSLAGCLPEVQEAAKAGLIGPNEWHTISQSTDQGATLALTLGGASREAVRKSVKKPQSDAVRTARIKCPLPSGTCVQVAGEEISLEEAIDALGDAVKLMKAALSKGLNVKTAIRYWSDIAAH